MAVKVTLFFDSKNCLKKIVSEGHSNSDETVSNKAHLGVCAALSAIEYQFLYSMKALVNANTAYEIQEGFFSMFIPPVDESRNVSPCCVETLVSSFQIGLQMICQKNPALIMIENSPYIKQ